MLYTQPATAKQPALLIYLIDLSASMNEDCGGRRRSDVVADALQRSMRLMIARSRRGDELRPRYAVAMLGYSSSVVDLLGGIKTIDQLERMQLPALNPQGNTNTGAAFEAAYDLLLQYLPNLQDCPAPLIFHLTSGSPGVGDDPGLIAEKIKQLGTSDGNVLIENLYIGIELLKQPIANLHNWPGVLDPDEITEEYVRLWHMASPLPESYAMMMNETAGYRMQPGAKMLIPAGTPEMIDFAFRIVFPMSTPTPIYMRSS